MPRKSVTPSVREIAFDCPHCGAYTSQTWFNVFAAATPGESRLPGVVSREAFERLRSSDRIPADVKTPLLQSWEKSLRGLVSLEELKDSRYIHVSVDNLNLSKCFTCSEVSVWIHDRLIFPVLMLVSRPNVDLPEDVSRDYEEAGRILNESTRGSAALLRLAIQKLCRHLGENGRSLDDDIGSLVRRGLSPLVQKSLDAVRVIGNEAVHPGALDLQDDRETASQLFDLVNIIAEQMISNPKRVDELYGRLPESKRRAIEQRDGPRELGSN
jgi:hypothetical protein